MRSGLVALALIPAISSCSDWIEPRSVDSKVNSLENQNPELYAAYVENLNEYKAGEHKVMFIAFENPAEIPVSRVQHMTALPDSVDYVSLNNPDNLSSAVTSDMKAVRKLGTKVVYDVNMPAILRDWDLLSREDATLTEEDALAYIEERTTEALAICDKWGYDGITFTYIGRFPAGLLPDDLAVYTARQSKFIGLVSEWRTAHAQKEFSFIGTPQYLINDGTVDNTAILDECDYIILSTELAQSEDELTTTAMWAVDNGAPSDRFIFRQYMFDVNDGDKDLGYFNTRNAAKERQPSIPIASLWMNKPSPDFVRGGMMILNVQLDYFQRIPTWSVTRQTIDTMNP